MIGTPAFNPATPGAIGGTTPAAITGTTITANTSLIVTSIVPGANLVITQNAVAAFTAVEASAAVNTLTMSAGNVAIGSLAAGGANRFTVTTVAGGAATALRLVATDSSDTLISAGGTGAISMDAPGIAGGRWVMLNGGEIAYGVTTPTTAVRMTAQGLAAATNDIQRWTAYTGTGTAGSTLAAIGGGGDIKNAATITAGGTTGARTIDKGAGSVNFAGAATTLVVTNSLVTASSLVFAVIATNDGTATIKNVVAGVGSFTITLTAAASGETKVNFWVLNPL